MTVAPGGPVSPPPSKRCGCGSGSSVPASTVVMGQFSAEDFHLIVDDRADVHVSSKDGRFSLGWFPLGRPGKDGEGWKIAITGTARVSGYHLSFDTQMLTDIVAAIVARVLETSRLL